MKQLKDKTKDPVPETDNPEDMDLPKLCLNSLTKS